MQAWLSFFAADSARMPVQTVLLTYNRLCTNAGLTVLLCSRHGTNAGPNSLADVVHVCVLWPAELGCSKGLSSVSSQSFSLVKRFWRYGSRYSLRKRNGCNTYRTIPAPLATGQLPGTRAARLAVHSLLCRYLRRRNFTRKWAHNYPKWSFCLLTKLQSIDCPENQAFTIIMKTEKTSILRVKMATWPLELHDTNELTAHARTSGISYKRTTYITKNNTWR